MRDGDVTDIEEVVGGGLTISISTFELSAETLVQQVEEKFFILHAPGFYQRIWYTETEIEGFFKKIMWRPTQRIKIFTSKTLDHLFVR